MQIHTNTYTDGTYAGDRFLKPKAIYNFHTEPVESSPVISNEQHLFPKIKYIYLILCSVCGTGVSPRPITTDGWLGPSRTADLDGWLGRLTRTADSDSWLGWLTRMVDSDSWLGRLTRTADGRASAPSAPASPCKTTRHAFSVISF